ncbi:MAG: hypothetical protein A3H96_09710 [Acidobacteria bacterium RIFCSPLOWO2_02_FULL_67_36]|nr:MAG: hypothetical protein A3H96_09710 [Acidobacteria bacterium RIFCSPLOWO2_02_FULL_67_36]OFW24953.1 MAG: hypothetical protein A3G21_16030 [Acidobacteria bacterium RIFCSPLOWO2_12_FULL_66_21]
MSTTTDHRKAAGEKIVALAAILEAQPETPERNALVRECKALVVAIDAFHMEGIRFRMFNVDRILTRGTLEIPADAASVFADARTHLEAAGFHTRSH